MRPRLSLGDWRPLLTRLPHRGAVGLTFDDGPTPETTPHLLNALAAAKAKATFFFAGSRVVAYPGLVAETVGAGHVVYGHGWEHVNLENEPHRAVADMCRVEDQLARYRPTPKKYLVRLPYNAGFARAAMHRALARFHADFQFAWWSHCTYDWLIPGRCRTAEDLVRECRSVAERLRQSRNLDGGVVLMHEQPFDVPSPFTAALTSILAPMVLDGLAQRSLDGVPLEPSGVSAGWRRWVLVPAH